MNGIERIAADRIRGLGNMEDGGSAFPVLGSINDGNGNRQLECVSSGMTLRDYFAGQVLAQIISRDTDPKKYIRDNTATAYLYADAMLAERGK